MKKRIMTLLLLLALVVPNAASATEVVWTANPYAPRVKTVSSVSPYYGKKANYIKASWSAKQYAVGYVAQISPSKSFSPLKKTHYIMTSATSTKFKCTKNYRLVDGKTYYIRVKVLYPASEPYEDEEGRLVVGCASKWSKVKAWTYHAP